MNSWTVLLSTYLFLWTSVLHTSFSISASRFSDNNVRKTVYNRQQGVEPFEDFLSNEMTQRSEDQFGMGLSAKVKCDACKLMAFTVYEMAREKKHEAEIVKATIKICIDSRIEDERVCTYIVPEYKDMALTVVRKDVLRPDQFCGLILGNECATPYFPTNMWNVTLPNTPKPPVQPPVPPAPGSPKVRFLQLTDIHIDMMYQPGRDALCGEPMCCRSNDDMPAPGVPGAGRWGDYRHCDIPLTLVDNLFQHLASKADQFDFIIFTGDIAAHDVWNQSRSDQISALERLVSYFEKYLPGKPVYFTAGNHDTAPCNSFPPPFITGINSQDWMYEAMADNWGKWLPANTRETILRAGFYTVSPYPGFRIISVNNNFCYINNWWLFINTTDPAGHLYWLAQTLQEAEDNGEKVFILQHHPTNCMKAWSWNFYRIVSRYESTIIGQFNGHTHNDEFRMYYDDDTLTRPVHVAYVAGSVTPYHERNPNYRIYTMDGFYKNSSFVRIGIKIDFEAGYFSMAAACSSGHIEMAVLDYENYIFNLSKNNNLTNPQWVLEYSPLSEYNMKGVSPSDWNDLIYRMKNDDELFNKFYEHTSRGGNPRLCTRGCKEKHLCKLKSGKSGDPRLCSDL